MHLLWHERTRTDAAQRIVTIIAATEEEPELRQHRNGTRKRTGDRHGQRIEILVDTRHTHP